MFVAVAAATVAATNVAWVPFRPHDGTAGESEETIRNRRVRCAGVRAGRTLTSTPWTYGYLGPWITPPLTASLEGPPSLQAIHMGLMSAMGGKRTLTVPDATWQAPCHERHPLFLLPWVCGWRVHILGAVLHVGAWGVSIPGSHSALWNQRAVLPRPFGSNYSTSSCCSEPSR
jgi:hypothetical protein